MARGLRVAINAQLPGGGVAGGIEQFVISLVHALGRLEDGDEEFLLVVPPHDRYWLDPYLGPRQRTITPDGIRRHPPLASRAARRLEALARRRPVTGVDRLYETLEAQVVHFPFQAYLASSLPSVFNPHDLQHLHFPGFFTGHELDVRERVYRAACEAADAVAVESRWMKDDVVRQYDLDPGKIHVVLRGSPTEAYGEPGREVLSSVRRRLELGDDFALYPAQTWPHKNHIRLAEAVGLLRDELGIRLTVVCTGRKNERHWPQLEAAVRELALEDQFRFPGFVSPEILRALYRAASFVVVPSLFEGGGFPVLEAFAEGAPLACSTATALPEYAGEAALLFDPASVEAIADALRRMVTDEGLRAELRRRGSERIRRFSWDRAARSYRALYRRLAGRSLAEPDAALVAATL